MNSSLYRVDTILFDWDGTLIDTAQRSFEAFVKQFDELGIAIDLETYERIYSPNWYSMYENLGLPAEKWKEADDLWLLHYQSEISKPMAGAEAALEELMRRNYGIGIVTSGSRERVLREINQLGFAQSFRVVVCSDDVANRKPHPEGLELAIRQMQGNAETCCYVGDSPDDIEMGRRAGVITIAIPGRYPSSMKLPNSHPDFSFDSLEQLVHAMPAEGRFAALS